MILLAFQPGQKYFVEIIQEKNLKGPLVNIEIKIHYKCEFSLCACWYKKQFYK